MTTDSFGYENDSIVTDRPADYRVELLPNGYASVYHLPSGIRSLIEPITGRFRSQLVTMPDGLIAEIQRRWGATKPAAPGDAVALKLLQAQYANLLAAARAAVAAHHDGEGDPLAYLRDELDAHGQLPPAGMHPAQCLAQPCLRVAS